MQFSSRALRFKLYRFIKRQNYQSYDSIISALSQTDPLSMSQDHLLMLLSHAGKYCEYYATFLSEPENLRRLPVLTKEIIRQNFDSLQSVKQADRTYVNSSGGSTGHPITLIQDTHYESWSNATQAYYFREFLGINMKDVKSVWLWGSERDTLKTDTWRTKFGLRLQNRLLLNTFDTSEERWLNYINRIKSYRPYYVAGYAGSLYQMARVARKNNVRLYQPKFLYSSAEQLRDFMRVGIEEQFNTRVYDYYGSREVGAIAGECAEGSRHVFIQNNIVEILDDSDQVVKNGEEGRIVVTNLHNYSMPMIRYDIGDTGSMGGNDCVCGSQLPVLHTLTGRVTDHFISKQGTLIHGEFFTHLFYFRDWVEQFQVDQLSLDRVRVSIVRRSSVDEEDVADITRNIRLVMGHECDVEWRYVDEIESTAEGKHLYTRCLMSK